jgi:hypothetical protein
VVLGLGRFVVSRRLVVIRRFVDAVIGALTRVKRVLILDHVTGRFWQLRLVLGELIS